MKETGEMEAMCEMEEVWGDGRGGGDEGGGGDVFLHYLLIHHDILCYVIILYIMSSYEKRLGILRSGGEGDAGSNEDRDGER